MLFEFVVSDYNITEAKPHIVKFKTPVDTFGEKFKADICLKQKFKLVSCSDYLIYDAIEFTLEWEVDKYNPKHIWQFSSILNYKNNVVCQFNRM